MAEKTKTIDEVFASLIRIKYPNYPKEPKDLSVARELDLTAQAFSNYKLGKRTPTAEQAAKIAQNWRMALGKIALAQREQLSQMGLPTDDKKLVAAVENMLKEAPIKQNTPLFDTIFGSGNHEFILTYLEYGVFSDGRQGLFDRICRRFFRQLGADAKPQLREQFKAGTNGERQVDQCYFATPSRVNAAFVKFPLRINLGAVAKSSDISHLSYPDWPDRLARSLYLPPAETTLTLPIRPLVVRDEVSYLHCVHTLGFEPQDPRMTIIPRWNEKDIRDHLRDGKVDEAGRIPVLITDEYTALRVRGAVEGAFLAIPVTTSRTNRQSVHRRELPQFFMSLACPAEPDDGFASALERSLGLFLSTELETTSREMVRTFFALEQEVYNSTKNLGAWSIDKYDPVRHQIISGSYDPERSLSEIERRIIARSFALYTMSLDRLTIEDLSPYPDYWQRILRRTREMVQSDTVRLSSTTDSDKPSGRRKETEGVIHSLLEDTPPGQARVLRRYSQLRRLNEYTDHIFDINQCRGHFEDELLTIVESQLCAPNRLDHRQLLTHRQDEEIEIVSIDPQLGKWSDRTSFEINGILELLNQLAHMYFNLPDPLPLPDDRPSRTPAWLYGTVSDSLHEGVPGATVAAFHPETGEERVTRTNKKGLFYFPSLNPGAHGVTASLGDLAASQPIALEEGSGSELDLKLIESTHDTVARARRWEPPTEGRQIFTRIEGEVKAQFHRYAQILLAVGKTKNREGKEALQHAGVVFILEQPGVRDLAPFMAQDPGDLDHLQHCCELRYLWVASPYRGRNVSRLLLVDALEWCRTKGHRTARLAILPQLEDAISRVNEVKFKAVQARPYDKAVAERRLIFENDLTQRAR